jgi:hypothetical protein
MVSLEPYAGSEPLLGASCVAEWGYPFYYYYYWIELLLLLLLVGWDFWYCGHYWPQDDRWWWLWRNWWNEDWQRKQKYSEKTCTSATLCTTNRTWLKPGFEPRPPRENPHTTINLFLTLNAPQNNNFPPRNRSSNVITSYIFRDKLCIYTNVNIFQSVNL